MEFKYKLRELRQGAGMSQEEFAELLGVSRQSVSKWESGKGYPELDKLIFISNYFNTSLDVLLKNGREPSTPISTKSTRVSKKRKSSIKLTKSSDIPTSNVETQCVDDPMPNGSKPNLSLRRMDVTSDTQIRPIKDHTFGYGTYKKHRTLSKRNIIIATAMSFIITIITMVLTVFISDTASEVSEMVGIAEDYSTNAEWTNLYDDDLTSDIEQTMIGDINYQAESILIDANDNVYYTGYGIVDTYIEAQDSMKIDLTYAELYEKYLDLKSIVNYIEVYSQDFERWVIIHKGMLRVYPEGSYVTYEVPECEIEYFDILSDPEFYVEESTSPFEEVYCYDGRKRANVSSEILDLCFEAMESRKFECDSMESYIELYKQIKDDDNYETITCYGREYQRVFVPKQFLMVKLSDLEREDVIEEDIVVEDADS